jgi:hypothetical protein
MTSPSDDDRVGYGRPPLHSRFRRGRSGNPSGRPRGKGLRRLLQEALDETVVLRIGGKRRRLSKAELVIAGLVERSAQGEWHSLRLLFDVMQKLEPKGRRDTDPDPSEQADAEDARERLIRKIDCLAAEEAEQERRAAALAEIPAAPDPEAGPDAGDTPSASAQSAIPGR